MVTRLTPSQIRGLICCGESYKKGFGTYFCSIGQGADGWLESGPGVCGELDDDGTSHWHRHICVRCMRRNGLEW